MQETARQVRAEAGDLLGIRKRECRLRAVVESGQETGRLATRSLAMAIMLRAQFIAL